MKFVLALSGPKYSSGQKGEVPTSLTESRFQQNLGPAFFFCSGSALALVWWTSKQTEAYAEQIQPNPEQVDAKLLRSALVLYVKLCLVSTVCTLTGLQLFTSQYSMLPDQFFKLKIEHHLYFTLIKEKFLLIFI